MRRLAWVLCLVGTTAVLAPAVGGSAEAPRLVLPYDLELRGAAVYIADGLRHQILRYDLARKRLTVFAGTGKDGTAGDGGPATKARLTEPTELVFDRAGNLYFSDVNQGRVRRIDRHGTITTVARVPAVAGLSVDPTGRYLAIASIEGFVYRMRLPSGSLERLAGDGTAAASGDGGPARAAQLNGPHDVTYDSAGNLLIAGYGDVRRIDATTGRITTAFEVPAFKLTPAPGGTFYLLEGSPTGGKVTQVTGKGKVIRVIGTGKLTPYADEVGIGEVGFLPSDVEPIPGGILITQTKPVPGIRQLMTGSESLTTLTR